MLAVTGDNQGSVPLPLQRVTESKAQSRSCPHVHWLPQDHRALSSGERPSIVGGAVVNDRYEHLVAPDSTEVPNHALDGLGLVVRRNDGD